MKWNVATLVSLSLIISLFAVWIFQGSEVYTKDKKQKIVKVKDDVFGTEIEKVEWTDDFRLGLLPGNTDTIGGIFLSVAAPAGVLVMIAGISFYIGRGEKRKISMQ